MLHPGGLRVAKDAKNLPANLSTSITGVVTAVGVALPQSSERPGVQTILAIESASQVVEFVYYAVAVVRYGGAIRTWTRYVDWFLSTPVMILSTCMFFEHRRADGSRDVLDVLTTRADFYVAATLNAIDSAVAGGGPAGATVRCRGVPYRSTPGDLMLFFYGEL